MRFYINGCSVEFKYSFLLIIAYALLFKNYEFLYVILFSILHEMGHLIALYLCGGKANKLVFAYYGIGLKHTYSLSEIKEFLFLSAGVLVNFVFVVLNIKREINLALLIINLFPIFPLDGGRILKLILNKLLCLNVSDAVFKIISIVVIALLVVLALYLKNISIALIVLYVIVYSLNNSLD